MVGRTYRRAYYRARATRAAKAAGAVHVHAGVHADGRDCRGVSRARNLALVGDDCELTSTSGNDGPSGQEDGSGPE
jgi:hypothetical protein